MGALAAPTPARRSLVSQVGRGIAITITLMLGFYLLVFAISLFRSC